MPALAPARPSDSDAGSTSIDAGQDRAVTQSGEPGVEQARNDEIGVGGEVERLDLEVGGAASGCPGDPATTRSAVSRFSGPQAWNAPAQWCGISRR